MKQIAKKKALDILVFGVVQGVGFRPYVYRTANQLGFKGWVRNIGYGVEIHLEKNDQKDFDIFLEHFKHNLPPLAQIEHMKTEDAAFFGCHDFTIKKTEGRESFVFISPDISVCDPCLKEMWDPEDRRYHYPFINCTDCGPRYTIVQDLPYDRPQTTMKDFKMCPDCLQEYRDPMNRRYHAQPIACPVCGPRIILIEARSGNKLKGDIETAKSLIKQGKILAVKGLGGFHLVCSAFDSSAVKKLRKIKARKTKPLALMAQNEAVIEKFAHINSVERDLLLSPRRPIVLLKKKKDLTGIAPHLDEMGFMLPYTPLHHLLLEGIELIVATSSNKKDAPIMKEEQEGVAGLCDIILTHDRPIQTRADDSVIKCVNQNPLFIRRARGYVPYPQKVSDRFETDRHILALGGELKDTISVHKNGYIITSQFLGDLDEYQNFQYFEETIQHLTRLFEVKPELIVSDLHPDFHTTRYAERSGLPHLRVQHHFAHILAPLLEHNHPLDEKVLGISLDGYGYGADGTAWGGEFLLADFRGFVRYAHFDPVHLPGGDLASKQPWRMALSYLYHVFQDNIPDVRAFDSLEQRKIKGVLEMMKKNVNSPRTSSCGRLFDAISFLAGTAPPEVEFEAEAPMRLESLSEKKITESYESSFFQEDRITIVSFQEMIRAVVADLRSGVPAHVISSKFHNSLAHTLVQVAEKARKEHEVKTVVLTGGVFLNGKLLSRAEELLAKKGFRVLRPFLYSPNDESISVGQIAFALSELADHSDDPNLISIPPKI